MNSKEENLVLLKEENDPHWCGFTDRPEIQDIGPFYEWVKEADASVWWARRKANVRIVQAAGIAEK